MEMEIFGSTAWHALGVKNILQAVVLTPGDRMTVRIQKMYLYHVIDYLDI